jgi:hypothetical protein
MRSVVWILLAGLMLPPAAAGEIVRSDSLDRRSVRVTVYNNNLGFIKEVRRVTLPRGEGELRFMDVAASIQPSTVHVASPGLAVLEQNYEYDLMNADKLLDKYVGKEIKIVDWNRYHDRRDVIEATLLSNNQGQVYRIGADIYLGHPGIKVLPELPESLIARPTLTWLFRSDEEGPRDLEVSYLTGDMQWRADYVLVLGLSDREGALSGWVTLDNRSGARYTDARLKLVAGAVHRVSPPALERMGAVKAMARAPSEGFREESLFEYHLYDLGRRTTIKDRQTKQIRLLEAAGIGVEKELLVQGSPGLLTGRRPHSEPRRPVSVYIRFANEEENRLGMPLPAGIVRVYKEDGSGSRQFVGEDRIEHTPRGERVRLKTGEAFDVVAERTQTDYRQVTSGLHETEWEVVLRNRKEEPVRVGILEPMAGNWEVLSHSHAYRKTDAFTIRFDVEVPPEDRVTVRYRIRVGL